MPRRKLLMLAIIGGLQTVPSTPGPTGRAGLLESLGNLPLSFEENQGQTDARVQYLSRGRGYSLFLTRSGAVLSLHARAASLVRMTLVGGHPNSEVSGVEELPGKSHYFIGNDPSRWRTNVPHYARVSYREVYPGVDLVYHGSPRQLEYDFVVSPGADPRLIRLRLDGPESVQLDVEGNLVLQMREGRLAQRAPFVYQDVEGERRRVAGNYVLHGGSEVGFELGAYDENRPLVIDPVLEYSTYLGGSGGDGGSGIAIDGSGSAYVTGWTFSPDFPTLNPYQTTQTALGDVFVTKLSPSGSSLVYSTYLGGNSFDSSYGIAVDGSGSAYVTGETLSSDFPTVNPYQTDQGDWDAFVTKLSPAGSSLVYSTYLGGSSYESGSGIVVDSSGSAYVTGFTGSANFPMVNPYQTDQPSDDAFVTKLSPSGSSLAYSTYLGGSDVDVGYGIAIDGSGSAYVTGETFSTDFPTLNPYQTDQGLRDAFATKLSPAGSSLVYSTHLGGSSDDSGFGIAVDGSGNAFVTGETSSTDFPAVNPYQTDQALKDVFVTKLSPAGSSPMYSTYLGGNDVDVGRGIAVDASGSAFVTGETSSTDFPVRSPYQTDQALKDAFVTKLSRSGSSLAYSTYLGGSDVDVGRAITVDASGGAYVAGETPSTDFPTLSPYQTDQGGPDAFVTKLAPTYAFYTLTPCRVVDTRDPTGPLGGPALACSSSPVPRAFPLGDTCGLPPTPRVISYNVAVTQPTSTGHLRLFPDGAPLPLVASINYSASTTRANNGIVLLGAGSLNVSCHQPSGTTHVIIDVNGYFE